MTGTYSKPLPTVSELTRPYFSGPLEGELRLQRCSECGHVRFPPAPVCPTCLSPNTEWFVTSGRGTLWSWIVMHQRYYASFAEDVPYIVALVKLEEGPWLISTLVGDLPEPLRCDLPVEAEFEAATDEVGIVKFRVVAGAGSAS